MCAARSLSARVSRSRPAIGVVDFLFEVINQNGETVMTQKNAAFIRRRAVEEARAMINFYEDFVVGEENLLGSHEFTREAIVAFARAWDPQRVPPRRSRRQGLDLRLALRLGLAHRLRRDAQDRRLARRASRGELGARRADPPARRLAGHDQHALARPDPAGRHRDLSFARDFDKRETKRPQWGLSACAHWGVNQDGHEAISFDSLVFSARRGA